VVEPQAPAAHQLRELYRGNDRIVILQAALDGKSGSRTLYAVESQTTPRWAGGLASFQRENVVKHSDLIPGLETMIREDSVDCITFDKVLGCLPDTRIDLLQIDTEGADGYILSLFPLDRVQPSIVHLGGEASDHATARAVPRPIGRLWISFRPIRRGRHGGGA
jgi:FkbM family methyltransferase